MFFVIAPDQQYLRFSRLAVLFRFVMTSPPASCRALSWQVFQFKLQNIFDNRPFKAHRVILFSLRTVAGHMLGGVVQPANKGNTRVDHHNFAMHPAKQDRKSTRLNYSHVSSSYAVFCMLKKIEKKNSKRSRTRLFRQN